MTIIGLGRQMYDVAKNRSEVDATDPPVHLPAGRAPHRHERLARRKSQFESGPLSADRGHVQDLFMNVRVHARAEPVHTHLLHLLDADQPHPQQDAQLAAHRAGTRPDVAGQCVDVPRRPGQSPE